MGTSAFQQKVVVFLYINPRECPRTSRIEDYLSPLVRVSSMKDEVKEFVANFIHDDFPQIYDISNSKEIWKHQCDRFKEFWENRIMKNASPLTEDEMIPIIQILDVKGKRRTEEERKVQGAAFTNIYQGTCARYPKIVEYIIYSLFLALA